MYIVIFVKYISKIFVKSNVSFPFKMKNMALQYLYFTKKWFHI